MVQALELLRRNEPEVIDERGPLTYTDKQIGIVRATLENPETDVEEVADMTDSHTTYVRSILRRADIEEVRGHEEFQAVPEGEDTEEEPDPDPDRPSITQQTQAAKETSLEEAGDITLSVSESIPVTIEIELPQDFLAETVDQAVQLQPVTSPEEEPEEEPRYDPELVQGLQDHFEVGQPRAERLVDSMGEDRARQFLEEEIEA